MKALNLFVAVFLFSVSTSALATLLTWDLTEPDTALQATFVYDDNTLDGISNNADLLSITGDFGDGLFTYLFNSTDTNGGVLYDTSDLSLTRWTSGTYISSVNASTSGTLSYSHTWYDESTFTLSGQAAIIADWNGASIEVGSSTQLSVSQGQAIPEPSTLAIFALGMIGLASRRFKKSS